MQLHELGQSVWLDNINDGWIQSGELARWIAEGSVYGVTSNPTIFKNAIGGDRYSYPDEIRRLASAGRPPEEIYEELAVRDITRTADLLADCYRSGSGRDGFVSLEVTPDVAHDTGATVAQARHYWKTVGRPNLFVKVPGTPGGIPAIETLIAEGISVNVTLLFGTSQVAAAAEAYRRGIERGSRRAARSRASIRWRASSWAGSTPRSTGSSMKGRRRGLGRRPRAIPLAPRRVRGRERARGLGGLPEALLRPDFELRRRGAASSVDALGVHRNQEPRLLRHQVRRGAGGPRLDQHDAQGRRSTRSWSTASCAAIGSIRESRRREPRGACSPTRESTWRPTAHGSRRRRRLLREVLPGDDGSHPRALRRPAGAALTGAGGTWRSGSSGWGAWARTWLCGCSGRTPRHRRDRTPRASPKWPERVRWRRTGSAMSRPPPDRPRAVWSMVPSGTATEQVLHDLAVALAPGDIVVDGGNSYYKESVRRGGLLRDRGIHFIDSGTSGSIWGLENGYCLMVGGDEEPRLEPVFATLAPPDGYLRVGDVGAGHFVKMIHNGIEYGLMEAYAEGFEILSGSGYALDLPRIASLEERQRGPLLAARPRRRRAPRRPEARAREGLRRRFGRGALDRDRIGRAGDPRAGPHAGLQARFRSRQPASFAGKLLAALRNKFGGHAVKTT